LFCIDSKTSNDPLIEQKIIEIYNPSYGDEIVYEYDKIDLNNDGNDEIFVTIISHGFVGSGGASGFLLKQKNNSYTLVNKFYLVNSPIILSNSTTNGWTDLIMNVKNRLPAIMKYDGQKYPSNPSVEPAIKSLDSIADFRKLSNSLYGRFIVGLKSYKEALIGAWVLGIDSPNVIVFNDDNTFDEIELPYDGNTLLEEKYVQISGTWSISPEYNISKLVRKANRAYTNENVVSFNKIYEEEIGKLEASDAKANKPFKIKIGEKVYFKLEQSRNYWKKHLKTDKLK
jgi:hypothetical protein